MLVKVQCRGCQAELSKDIRMWGHFLNYKVECHLCGELTPLPYRPKGRSGPPKPRQNKPTKTATGAHLTTTDRVQEQSMVEDRAVAWSEGVDG